MGTDAATDTVAGVNHTHGGGEASAGSVAEGNIPEGTPPVGTAAADCCSDPLAGHGYSGQKEAHLRRLKRIEGQVRGLQRMVEEEQYCIDILTQISAATSALRSVALGLVETHIEHCVVDAARQGQDAAQAKIKEATDAIARLARS